MQKKKQGKWIESEIIFLSDHDKTGLSKTLSHDHEYLLSCVFPALGWYWTQSNSQKLLTQKYEM